MNLRPRSLALSLLLLTSAACRTHGGATSPPRAVASTGSAGADISAGAPAPPVFSCGTEVCAPDQLCEERFKGHATDDEGRPLQRKKCVPLPPSCQRTATCDCVLEHLSANHCTDAHAQVHIDDYPR